MIGLLRVANTHPPNVFIRSGGSDLLFNKTAFFRYSNAASSVPN
jgi:hypothetical protein